MPTQIPVRTEASWVAAGQAVIILTAVAAAVISAIVFVVVWAYT